MPRNPATKKGHHNNRHENGLVGPGKRVAKQKSNSQLNGQARSTLEEPISPPPTAQPPIESPSAQTTAIDIDEVVQPEETRWRKRVSESSSDSHEQKWEHTNGTVYKPYRQGNTTVKPRTSYEFSAVQMASSILRSSPAFDTVALLIVLLALPSMVLTLVQALFASLTLLPPSGGLSPVAFLSLFDVFQGTTGSPSILTMGLVDLFCFFVWIMLWTWAQNIALDLAQIQIALTLGTGSSSRTGIVNSSCFLLILVVHTIRSNGVRSYVISKIPPAALANSWLIDMVKHLPSTADFGDSPGPPSRFRSIFAIHIISQAIMAFIRRRIAGSSSATKTVRRDDGMSSLDSSAQDSVFNAASGTHETAPNVLHARESRDKLVTTKKRRRQANQVRSRQPFWAALASTKVHVLREVEHSRQQQGSLGTDTPRNEARISASITSIEPTTVDFEIGYLNGEETRTRLGAPYFFVCVNNARWHSVNIEPLRNSICDGGNPVRWVGSVSGLAPNCPYELTFCRVSTEEDNLLACVRVQTPAMGDRDQMPVASTATRAASRPLSATTTLRGSIQQAERSRDDAINKRTRVRKSQVKALAKVDRDIESQQSKLRSGGDDQRLRQKLLQAERLSQQHKEHVDSLMAQLDELDTIPEDEVAEYSDKKAAFELSSNRLAHANESLSNARSEANNDLNIAKSELSSILSRKERLVAKNSKLQSDQERITEANSHDMSERDRKAVESEEREVDLQRQEAEWKHKINVIAYEINEIRQKNEQIWRDIQVCEDSQREAFMRANGPLTPEGDLPGTNPFPSRAALNAMPPSMFVPDPHASPFQSFAKQAHMFGRPRAGTGQSVGNMGGIMEFEEPDPIPPTAGGHIFETTNFDLNDRTSSGSSRKDNHSPADVGVIGSGYVRGPQRSGGSPGPVQAVNSW